METVATMIEGRRLRGWQTDLLGSIALGLAYYLAARLSLRLALVGENITPLWPPTGIAVVGFLLGGRRLWPGVAIAAFAVNLPISANVVAAATTTVGNTLAPVIAATLLGRVEFRPQLDRLRDALAIVFLAALGSMLISATIGATTLLVSGAIDGNEFLGAWSVWWAGDAMGVLVVAPFLLTLTTIREHPVPRGAKVVEAIALAAVLMGILTVVVVTDLPILFLLFPVLGWAAWRFLQPGAAPAALLTSLFATWAAVEGRGLFAGQTLSGQMLTLQAFNVSVAFTSLFFAAVVSERARARLELEAAAAALEERVRRRTTEVTTANDRLAEAQELAHLGSWDWDVATGTVHWSREMYRIYGIPSDEVITFDRAIELVRPDDRGRIQANIARALAERRARCPTSSTASCERTARRGSCSGRRVPNDPRTVRSPGWSARCKTSRSEGSSSVSSGSPRPCSTPCCRSASRSSSVSAWRLATCPPSKARRPAATGTTCSSSPVGESRS